MNRLSLRPWLLVCLMAAPLWIFAQSNNQSITGTVTDSSGAVLPGVAVTVVNEGTGLTRSTVTNESGNYTVPQIPIGQYRVEAELPGFRKEIRRGVTLQVDQRIRIDLPLQVGQVSEVVDVTGEAPLIQTEDSSIGSIIDNRKVTELPLNGRNFESLVQLTPAAVTANQGSHLGARGGFVVAGMDEHYQSFYVDGIDNVDTIVRNFSYRPSVDAIQEFKVQSSGYAAEYGRNAGAVINVTTKSGTNNFHGAAWNYHRNSALDARDFFDPAGIPGFLRNQFGGNIGGRIIRDKTFFFFNYEGLRERRAVTRAGRVPSLAFRNGDFSALATPIRDPFTGQAFPGNVIPRARWDRLATEALDFWPAPNREGSLNLVTTPSAISNFDNYSIKIDHAITAGNHLSARYSYANEYIFGPFGGETDAGRRLPNFGQYNPRYRTSAGFNVTSVLSNSLVNEFRFGANQFEQPLTTEVGDLAVRVGLKPKGLPPVMASIPRNRNEFDTFNLSGVVEPLGAGGGFWRLNNTFNGINNTTWTKGNHGFKFGADVRRLLFYNITGASNTYSFDGRYTGNAFADYLLGTPFQTNIQVGPPGVRAREYGHEGKWDWAIYFQDDWKVNSRLTLNWGIRYEYYVPLTAFNGLSGFDRPTGKIRVICTEKYRAECGLPLDPNLYTVQFWKDGDFPIGMHEPDKNNLAPRLGFAFRPFTGDGTVIRGGYGVYYDSDDRQKSFSHVKNAPFNASLTYLAAAGQTPQIQLTSNPFPAALGRAGAVGSGAIERKLRNTYAQMWNLGFQHQLRQGLLLDMAYQGSLTLKGPRTVQINQPLTPGPGSVASRRPFPAFGPLAFTENSGKSNFHSLQAKVEQRFSNGLSFIGSYMWGKALDNRFVAGSGNPSNAQNAYNLGAEYGPSAFDLRQKLAFSYVYELPFGPGKSMLSSGPAANILGGWQMSGIVTVQGGRPFTPVITADNSNVGIGADRPNLVGNPVVDHPTPERWYNPSAFATPAPFTFGNAGRGILWSDGIFTLDFSLGKTFQIAESKRLVFKSEFFNFTNHTNFGVPENRVNLPTAGTISSTTTTSRQIQFGLRFLF